MTKSQRFLWKVVGSYQLLMVSSIYGKDAFKVYRKLLKGDKTTIDMVKKHLKKRRFAKWIISSLFVFMDSLVNTA